MSIIILPPFYEDSRPCYVFASRYPSKSDVREMRKLLRLITLFGLAPNGFLAGVTYLNKIWLFHGHSDWQNLNHLAIYSIWVQVYLPTSNKAVRYGNHAR